MITFSIVVGAPTLIYNLCTSGLGGVADAPGVRVPDKAGAMFKRAGDKHCTENLIRHNGPDDPFLCTLANTTWKSNSDFLHEVRQIPEITKVIPEAELVKLCSVEQHFNHNDETLASWKRRRISRPAMNLRLTIPPTVI